MTVHQTPPAETFARDVRGPLPAQKLLDGLARCHESVFLAEQGGRVFWSSEGMTGLDLFIDRERRVISTEATPSRCKVLRVGDHHQETNPDLDIGVLSSPANGGESLLVAVAREENAPSLDASTRAALGAVLGTAPDAVLAIDMRGRISFANPAAEEVLGWAPSRIVGLPAATLIADIEELECLLGCLQGHESLRDRDLTFRGPLGDHRNVSASSSPLGSHLCREPHTLFYLRDVGARACDAELIRTNEELEHCINSLAHDLRSPLVALRGFSRLLRMDYAERLDETARHFIERIEQAGQTMESLVHDLLELSRIGQPNEIRVLVNPRSVLAQLKAELKPKLDAAGVDLAIPDDPPLIFCDRTRLYQVFSNLIGNALEHAGLGSGAQICVEVRDASNAHQISVRDPGCGIPRENHERVFEVFQSFSRGGDKKHGAGIGLAIVKKIAETHGGRVWVESEPGMGATFHVTFPKVPILG